MNRKRNAICFVGLVLVLFAVSRFIPPIRHTMTFILTFIVESSKCMLDMVETFKHL